MVTYAQILFILSSKTLLPLRLSQMVAVFSPTAHESLS